MAILSLTQSLNGMPSQAIFFPKKRNLIGGDKRWGKRSQRLLDNVSPGNSDEGGETPRRGWKVRTLWPDDEEDAMFMY